MGYEIGLLGAWTLRARHDVVPVPPGQLRILLTSLALSANDTVRVHTISRQLWPERPPAQAEGAVHTYVGRLRKLLGRDLIHTVQGGGYRLVIPAEAVDVHRFRRLLRRAREAGSAREELALLRSALELWRGAPFADLYSTWLDRDVAPRLTEEWLAATGRRIDLELATGQPEPLVAELRDLTAAFPARESLWLRSITALYRAGRRAEALDTYRRLRTMLRRELGIEPGEQLVRLHREILLDGSDNTVSLRQLPHDITRFSGRADELAELSSVLSDGDGSARHDPAPIIIAIDGPPGVGKTALAVRWAHRVAHRYPDAQLFLDLRGHGPGEPVTPEAAAERMLRALGVCDEQIPSDPDDRSAMLRSKLSGREALILLDNARDAEQVRPLLPGGHGLVVITSRSPLHALSIRDGARRMTLRPLARQQSIDLLYAALGRTRAAADPAAAATLAERCGGFPLALAIAAERARRAGSLAAVVAEFAQHRAGGIAAALASTG